MLYDLMFNKFLTSRAIFFIQQLLRSHSLSTPQLLNHVFYRGSSEFIGHITVNVQSHKQPNVSGICLSKYHIVLVYVLFL